MECARRYGLLFLLLVAASTPGLVAKGDEPAAPVKEAPSAEPATEAKDAPPAKDPAKKAAEEDYELYQIFADTLDQVERNYVKNVSRRELMEAAIHGILGKLDPYSNYISPDDIGRFKTSVENQFGGIGIQIDVDGGQLKIVSPLFGTPAYRAGLESGDTILEIDGKPTEGIHRDEAVRRLKGEPGSKVALSVRHLGETETHSVSITREWVHVETVLGDRRKSDDSWDFMLDHDKHIGYIRLSAFSRDTAQDLKKALVDLQGQGLKGLILDLRFNPGGLLTSAIEVSDLFVAEGRIVSTEGRNTPQRTWEAQKDGTFDGFPLAVLVNHYSASASEIVSACLQDHSRGVVIGERTFGKGSVQNVIELEGGKSALKLTTASYHRPSGKNIHRFPNAEEADEWGVMPNEGFDVRLNGLQTKRLIEYRHDRDILVGKHARAAIANPQTAEKSEPNNSPEAAAAKSTPPAEPAKPADPATPAKPAGDDAAKDADSKDGDSKDGKDAQPAKENQPFVDLQLQKAIDYLGQELARAQ